MNSRVDRQDCTEAITSPQVYSHDFIKTYTSKIRRSVLLPAEDAEEIIGSVYPAFFEPLGTLDRQPGNRGHQSVDDGRLHASLRRSGKGVRQHAATERQDPSRLGNGTGDSRFHPEDQETPLASPATDSPDADRTQQVVPADKSCNLAERLELLDGSILAVLDRGELLLGRTTGRHEELAALVERRRQMVDVHGTEDRSVSPRPVTPDIVGSSTEVEAAISERRSDLLRVGENDGGPSHQAGACPHIRSGGDTESHSETVSQRFGHGVEYSASGRGTADARLRPGRHARPLYRSAENHRRGAQELSSAESVQGLIQPISPASGIADLPSPCGRFSLVIQTTRLQCSSSARAGCSNEGRVVFRCNRISLRRPCPPVAEFCTHNCAAGFLSAMENLRGKYTQRET